MSRRSKMPAAAIVTALVASVLVGVTAGPAVAAVNGTISSVEATASNVVVTGEVTGVPASSSADVYAIGPERTAMITGASQHVSATIGAGGQFTATFPRTSGGEDNLYSQFVLRFGGVTLTDPHFANSLSFSRPNTAAFPTAPSKKGLGAGLTDDNELLGVNNTGLNIDLTQLMLLDDVVPANTITFSSGGVDYYFDKSYVESIDTEIKPLSDNGVLVNMIILILKNSDPNSAVSVLMHPGAAVSDPSAGPVFGFNTETEAGRKYLTAAAEFLASRYQRADQAYGRAIGWIVGNEIQAPWVWSNSGDLTQAEFMDDYSRAVRIFWQATTKYWTNARTYISLAGNWNDALYANPNPSTPTRFFKGKDALDMMNTISKSTGDFPWAVAYHSYPQDLFKPDSWNDQDATNSFDTKFISFKNIGILPDYLEQSAFLYDGVPRRVALTEQGCHSPSSSLEDEQLQAACYAYAYYKILFEPSIDIFTLSRGIDHRDEGGLKVGLWEQDPNATNPSAPLRQKYIYDVFKYIDTDRSLEVTEFALDIIGVDSWGEVVPGFNPAALDLTDRHTAAATRSQVTLTGATTSISTFASGADGWINSHNVASFSATGGALSFTTKEKTFAKQWRGVEKTFSTAVAIGATPWLSADITIPSNSGLGETTAIIQARGTNGKIVDGTARVVADGTAQKIAVDLSSLGATSIARMKVWVKGTGTGEPAQTMSIDNVQLSAGTSASGKPNISVSASTSAPDSRVGSPVQFVVTNYDKDSTTGSVTLDSCGELTVSPSSASIPSIPSLGSGTLVTTISAFTGAAASTCMTYKGETIGVPVVARHEKQQTTYHFDGSTNGWLAGSGTAGIASVTSSLNPPVGPHSGTAMLEATGSSVPGSTPRSVYVEPEAPLNWDSAREGFTWIKSWGGAPGASSYTAELKFTSSSGATKATTATLIPDAWNRVAVQLDDWSGRDAIARIDVVFKAVGGTANWAGKFQIDEVGYTQAIPYEVLSTTVSGFNGGVDSWQAGSNTASVASVASSLNSPTGPHSGSGMLEATGDLVPGDTARSIFVAPASPYNWASARDAHVWLKHWGGAPGATTYTAKFTLTGTDSTTKTVTKTLAGGWNKIALDIHDWAGRTSISRIDVDFRAVGGTSDWAGKFQIDDLGYTENVLFGFEGGTEGWVTGRSTQGVAAVTSTLASPGVPQAGAFMLEATGKSVAGGQKREALASFRSPIDLSSAKTAFAWFNSWGGAPSATSYTATITLSSLDGTTRSHTATVAPASWNRLSVDIHDWPGRSSVDRVKITFVAVGSSTPWAGKFQLDSVGFTR